MPQGMKYCIISRRSLWVTPSLLHVPSSYLQPSCYFLPLSRALSHKICSPFSLVLTV